MYRSHSTSERIELQYGYSGDSLENVEQCDHRAAINESKGVVNSQETVLVALRRL